MKRPCDLCGDEIEIGDNYNNSPIYHVSCKLRKDTEKICIAYPMLDNNERIYIEQIADNFLSLIKKINES